MKDILARNLDAFLEEHREGELAGLLAELHPADAAELIMGLEEEEDRSVVFSLLTTEMAPQVLMELPEAEREDLVQTIPAEQLSRIISEMDSDDAADVVGGLDDDEAAEVLGFFKPEESAEVRRLLLYDEDTAGGIMQLELVRAKEDETQQEVVEHIRRAEDEVEGLNYVYVVDRAGRLRGWVTLRRLLLARPDDLVRDLMSDCELVINVHEDQEAVVQKFKKYDSRSSPVVDDQGRLLGRITVDDVFDVFHEEVDEDFYRMAGTSEEEIYSDSVFKISRLRLPWLLANLSGGLVTGYLVWQFKVALRDVLALVTFIPAIMALGGSVGIQSSTIVVRNLALNRLPSGRMAGMFFKELRVALVMGLVCGIGGALVAKLWHGQAILGLVVGLSMFSAIILSSVLGALTPAFFRRLNIDPALAAGPFVTMCNDILGILLYMGIATVFLKFML
jgi:magnesium transporter